MSLKEKNDGGPVAQLGEHLVCNQGVRGSSPLRSTKLSGLVSLNYETVLTQSPLRIGNIWEQNPRQFLDGLPLRLGERMGVNHRGLSACVAEQGLHHRRRHPAVL